MTDTIRVFINGIKLDLPAGSSVADALAAVDDGFTEKLAAGALYITDGRGVEIDSGVTVTNGAIVRVVVRAQRGTADVDP
ncbi:MAG TPA: hypothetical protein VFH40_13795 [Gemmatimonadales bacterium]|jgi:hypothetical protein|nr:hypothetical protein [Gemmatimonadales bacterium]